ncbi:MAG: PASTA domain-containing protein [Bacteroidales bacterium]|nr:PASTA domain-containing protein [Bacteroidales bacterium]
MKNGFTGFLKKFFINIAAMAAVVVAICYFTLAWLDDYTLHGQVIDVPDVCGMNIDEAGTLLRDAKLDYEVVDYKYKKGARENDVVEQQPLRGSQVKEGRKIQLTLNSAREPEKPLPDIVDNCSLREAVARLTAAGFKLTENIKVSGEADWVYTVLHGADTLQNGTPVPVGSTLTLCIGNGSEIAEESEPVMEESWFE